LNISVFNKEKEKWILLKTLPHLMNNLKKSLQDAGNAVKLKCVLNILFVVLVLIFIPVLNAELLLIKLHNLICGGN
jgi:succinate dehydrogenase hydrophobic anchor subunit